VGVQAGVAPGAITQRSQHGLRRRGRCRYFPLDRWRRELEGTFRSARPWHRTKVAAGRGRHVPAHDYSRSQQSAADIYRHLSRGCVSYRRRRQNVEANQSRTEVPIYPRPRCRDRTLCSSCGDEPEASWRTVHAEALGRDAVGRCGRQLEGSQRKSADGLRIRD